jgi:hypothetical protein
MIILNIKLLFLSRKKLNNLYESNETQDEKIPIKTYLSHNCRSLIITYLFSNSNGRKGDLFEFTKFEIGGNIVLTSFRTYFYVNSEIVNKSKLMYIILSFCQFLLCPKKHFYLYYFELCIALIKNHLVMISFQIIFCHKQYRSANGR